MAIEQKWPAVAPKLFTTNGGAQGQITVADARGFKVKQFVVIKATSLPDLRVQVKRVTKRPNDFLIIVGPPPEQQTQGKAGLRTTTDLTLYTVALGASIFAEEQDKNKIKPDDIIQAIYRQEPGTTIGVELNDQFGVPYDSVVDSSGINRLAVDGQFHAVVDVQVDVDIDGVYDAIENPDPDNIGLIANVRNVSPDETGQTQRLTAVTNGSVRALDISLHDTNGLGITSTSAAGKQGLDVNIISAVNVGSVDQGNPNTLANAWPIKITDGVDLALVTAAGALMVDGSATVQPVSQSGAWTTGRTWTLDDTTDSIATVQSGAWTVGRTWTLSDATDSIASVQSGTWITDRSWVLDNSTDSVTSFQGGAWATGRTWVLDDSTDSVSAVQSGTWDINDITGTVSLPTNAAQETGGNLAAINAKLNSLGQKTMAGSVPVVLASDQTSIPVTQSGAWTVGRTWTLSSGTDSVSAVQSGTWNINNITGTVSLPTGAATEAKQDVGNTSLASIDSALDVDLSTRASEATLSAINNKLVSGTDIGDVTINNAAGAAAVNIQDGGNTITVDAVDLDIRNLSSTQDSVKSLTNDGAGTAITSTLNNSKQSLDVFPNLAVTSGNNTRPDVTNVSSVILAANTNRKMAIITNQNAQAIYLKLGATAVASQGIILSANSTYEITAINLWTGSISAIRSGVGTSTLDVFEGT